MREELHRFFRAARGAGVRVSPAESIDAMNAVADVGFADRAILRDTLLLTLAKNQDEKRALGETFDLFFSQPEVKDETPPEDADENAANGPAPDATASETGEADAAAPEMGDLAQMLMSQDRNAVAAALAVNPSIRVLCCPGRYHPSEGYVFGTQTIASINSYEANRAIVSATGIEIGRAHV